MADSVQLALVGCGGIAGAHVQGYAELYKAGSRDFEYVACCDINEAAAQERAKTLADIQGTAPKVFTDLDEMIGSGAAEAADICAPHWLHHSLAIQCIEGGLHTIVEKPIGITVKATKKIIEAGKEAGKVVATAEQIRRFQTARAFRWAIAEKKLIGDVHIITNMLVTSQAFDFDNPAFKWRGVKLLTGGGMIMDSGAHYADMMVYIFGEPEEIDCTMWILDRRVIEDAPVVGDAPADVETAWHAIIRFKSGVEATWMYGREFCGPNEELARYYGGEGTIHNESGVIHPFQTGGNILLRDGTEMSTEDVIAEYMASLSDDEKNRLFPYGCTNGFSIQTWDFVNAIRTGGKPEMDGEAGLRAKALCETCYESATVGKPVKYDDVLSGKACEYQKPIDNYWKI